MRAAKLLSGVGLGGLLLLAAARLEAAPPKRPVPERASLGAKRGGRARPAARTPNLAHLNLFMLPTEAITLIPPWLLRDPPANTPPSRRRPIFTMEGILLGDYYLVPNLVFATDNRYDDANTRERALRDEMNYQDARRRGELREDPLTQLLRKKVRRLGGDPGFRVALVIHSLLQGALQNPTKSVELTVRPDGRVQGVQVAAPAAAASPPATPLSIVSPKRYEGGNQVTSPGSSGFPGSAEK